MPEFWKGVILFTVLQLTNVILSTMRSILTVKSTKEVASIVSAISYTFYAAVVRLITEQDMAVVLIVTFLTNLIGVYVANVILNLLRKDKLWIFTATIKDKSADEDLAKVRKVLDGAEIKYVFNEVVPNKLYSLQIFSYAQKESTVIRSVLDNYNIKYFITESK